MGDHDSLFKRAFSVPAHAAGEIRSVLPPEVTERLDLAALELVPSSFVDAEMAHRHADLLFSVPLSGRRSYVYFLFEHQSEPDALMIWRVLGYQQRIWDATVRVDPERRSLPAIVTIVVHHGPSGWRAPRRFHDVIEGLEDLPGLRRFVPDFDLLVDDLGSADDESLQRRPLATFPKIALWLLRDGRQVATLLDHLGRWGAELERLARSGAGHDDVRLVLRYILRVAGHTPHETVRQRVADVAPTFEEAMASSEEQLIERGMQKGIEKGMQRTLVRLLRARFGEIDATVEARIGAAPSDTLERWVDRVFVASTVDEVLDG